MKKLISICITTLFLSSCSGDFLDLAPQHTGVNLLFSRRKSILRKPLMEHIKDYVMFMAFMGH